MPTFNLKCQPLGDFVDGRFRIAREVNGDWVTRSPANWLDEMGRFTFSFRSVDEAVTSARDALPRWKRLSVAERCEFLKKFQSVLKKREADWIEVIAREIGKPIWEAKTEVSAMVNKVDITLQESLKLVQNFRIPEILEHTLGACQYKPLGVLAVIGPFNFPGHLPNGHIIPALMMGNTLVFKPSERAPWAGQMMAEAYQEAGLPPGVFNLVQGEKEVSRRLSNHEGIHGVLFTGSYEVGVQIKQDTIQQHWKMLALEMGGKNSAIVCEDADLDVAVYETLLGAFLTAGQRCSATSRILVDRRVLGKFVDQFHARAKRFAIGHPLDNPMMGPLIDQGAVDRYLKFQGIAEREGFELVMRGKSLELPHRGNYVTPSICVMKECTLEQTKRSTYQQTELFSPNIAILGVDHLEEAIAQANSTQFGLVSSVFSRSRASFDQCLNDLEAGLINWNKSTVGASSRLPFGGLKKSGNHRPTALSAPLYCAVPVSTLEVSEPSKIEDLASKIPGLNWVE